MSEIQRKVSLIGGVWDYVNAGSDGKIELISPKNKLKFNVKENVTIPSLNLSIAPVIAKLNFRQRKIKNLLILSTFAITKKRKISIQL